MPRAKKKSGISVPQALAAVSASLNQLMQAIASAAQAPGAPAKAVAMPKVGVAAIKAAPAKGPGSRAGNPAYHKAQKGVWARYTPKQREERIRKMLAARGVKRKGASKK